MKKLNQLALNDRPREKLKNKGAQALSHLELVAIILGSGIKGHDVFEVARGVVQLLEKPSATIDLPTISAIKGMGLAKAGQILAAFELAKRFLIKENIKIESAEAVYHLVPELRDKRQEYFLTLTLDGANHLLQKRTVFIGTLNESLIHPREIFADAILDRAAHIILVHNHPSGILEPSLEDHQVTKRLREAGELLGITVLDHVIVGKNGFFSFVENLRRDL